MLSIDIEICQLATTALASCWVARLHSDFGPIITTSRPKFHFDDDRCAEIETRRQPRLAHMDTTSTIECAGSLVGDSWV